MMKRICIALSIVIVLCFTGCEKNIEKADIIDINSIEKYEESIEYVTSKVVRIDLKEDIKEKILIMNRFIREISFDHDVIVKSFNVNKNKRIPKGTLILEVDSSDIDRKIESNIFQLQQEKKYFDKMKELGYSDREIELQKIEVQILQKKQENLLKKKRECSVYAERDCYLIYGSPQTGKKYLGGEALVKLSESTDYIIKTQSDKNLSRLRNVDIGDTIVFNLGDNRSHKAEVSYIERNSKEVGEIYFKNISIDEFIGFGINPTWFEGEFDSIVQKNALVVNSNAVINGDKTYVQTIKNGVRRVRYVKVGASGVDENGERIVEILSGLKEGESVIVGELNKRQKEIFKK